MKLIELIEQKMFIRGNDGIGYNVTIEGDIEIACYESDDTIHVFHNGSPIDTIDLHAECKDVGFCCRAYVMQEPVVQNEEAAIVIMKSHTR